jgi:hypothetical protein
MISARVTIVNKNTAIFTRVARNAWTKEVISPKETRYLQNPKYSQQAESPDYDQ